VELDEGGLMTTVSPTALIAEDEPLLALNLAAELRKAWPELTVLATVGHGEAAVRQSLELRPDVLFLDIRMPAMTGLEAAEALTEDWPEGVPLPLIVFVTAYEQYAVQAFERSASDYVLKPVQPDRLAATCARLRVALQRRDAATRTMETAPDARGTDETLERLRQLLVGGLAAATGMAGAAPSARLNVIQASVGTAIHMVPVGDVVYFEAADKYIRVVTSDREYLIRTSLKELLPQLDPQRFWQIHRGTLVRDDAIATALRDEVGKVTLTLKGRPERLPVSRLYAPRFKAM
jgi:DNA-binding LytR/AlgR family response regulator